MKIALVHDYLTQRGGAERVFELLCRRFPTADIYTALYDPDLTIQLSDRTVRTSPLQHLPGASKYFRLLAPFYYPAFRTLDLQEYDLILTSTSSFAKAVRKRPDAYHICFCHNVTRFLWDTSTYLREYKDFQMLYPIVEKIFQTMRNTDLRYAQEPDLYIANSTTVARRIQQIYNRPALVANYPIDVKRFLFSDQKEDFYLASARLLSYKKIDVIVQAFNQLGWKLVVTGDGPERQRLESIAGDNITFLGHVSDEKRCHLMAQAKAVIVAALEDYGLVPIEANASGTPVISYGAGGVLDTQVPGETGLFFEKQAPEALMDALVRFQGITWNYAKIREHAVGHFTESVFFEKIDKIIQEFCNQGKLLLAV